MTQGRIPGERVRWLSAVLIVTAIIGASAAVQWWPVGPPPSVPVLASRPLTLIDVPILPARAELVLTNWQPAPMIVAGDNAVNVKPAPAAVLTTMPADVDVTAEQLLEAPPVALPLLASRSLELALEPVAFAPPVVIPVHAAWAAPDDLATALVELPAVAVTRVVTVAGRGIRTGIRATSAMFKAAF